MRVHSSAEISRIECVVPLCTPLTAFGTDVAVESFESNASATGLTNSLSERFVKFSAFFGKFGSSSSDGVSVELAEVETARIINDISSLSLFYVL